MPVQAAAGAAALPVAEAALEAEADADGSTEGDNLTDAVPEAEVEPETEETEAETQLRETEIEPQIQETETEVQAQDADKSELTEDPADASALSNGLEQKDGAAPAENADQKDASGLTGDAGQKDDSGLVEAAEQENASTVSGDPALADQSVPEAADGTAAAEADPASIDETAYTVCAESTVSSVSAKAAAGVTSGIDRIHFITLNGSYSDSDAILIESNGKYGLIDSSNPSRASSDPDFAFTSEYVDTAANGLTVVKYLTDLNVSHLEFVLATHSHSDHVGGMTDIAGSGLVNNNTVYIYKGYQPALGEREWHNEYYANLALEAMRAKNATLLNVLDPSSTALRALGDDGGTLIKDSTDRVGDHLEFTLGDFVIRLFNLHTESTVDENLNSIVTAVKNTNSNSGALLMADMEQQHYMESRTVDAVLRNDKSFKADVYKAGHHGYYTSTSYDTLKTLKPANYVMTTRSTSSTVSSYTLAPYFVQKFGGKVYRTSENGPAVIAEFGDSSVTMKRLTKNKTTTTPVQWKPVVSDGWYMWYPNEDSYNRTGVKWSYFKSGAAVKGWFYIGSNWYHTDDNYILQTGWINVDGKRYLLNGNGVMQTGWTRFEGKWYYLHNNGVMHVGWIKDNGSWYYMGSDGAMRVGRQTIHGKTYVFDSHGVMQTGWANYAGKWYYLNSDGTIHIGWIKSGSNWYYMGSDGAMRVGRQTIGGKTYIFNTSTGAMQTGWTYYSGKWYILNSDGTIHIGWIKSGSYWYYMGSDGTMQTGRKVLGGKTYFFSTSTGAMQTGWVYYSGKWYYTNSDGTMHIGWRKVNGSWYYFGNDGTMRVGRQTIGGKTYFFNFNTGVMLTGWINYSGKWYYLESSGVMATNKWIGDYYVKSNGEMAVNQWVGSYYVGADGKWIPGYKKAS